MRCYICDRVIYEPKYDSEYEAYDPCESCLLVIEDAVASYTDKPSADEDDLGGPEPLPLHKPHGLANLPEYEGDEDFT